MDRETFEALANSYLTTLCEDIPSRRLGSSGNRQATAFFAQILESRGFAVTRQAFDCLDWADEGGTLEVGAQSFDVLSSPYSLNCDVQAELVVARTVDEIQKLNPKEKVLLLLGEIAAEQIMPKEFPFYNPDHHRELVALLENKSPLAIMTATGRNPELAGGMYPFPMFEDGDLDIPSVYLRDTEGERLARLEGEQASLRIRSERIPSTGENVIGSLTGDQVDRIVLCAHIDAKDGTPGALDNATGVAMLLVLADLLRSYTGRYSLELLAFNGEDHYSAQGHKVYIRENQDKFGKVVLAINTDVAGYIEGRSAFSLYGLSEKTESIVRRVMRGYESLEEGEQWYQSDHSIFIQQGRPAMAITSDRFMELSTNITHTPKDSLDLVDLRKLVDISSALRDLLIALP